MAKVLEQAEMLVFSSQSVQADFQRYYPATDIPTAVLPFYSLPEPGWYAGDSAATAAKYGLPERYFICCNQFWLHKNHKVRRVRFHRMRGTKRSLFMASIRRVF